MHITLALYLGVQLVANRAFTPASIPRKEATRSDKGVLIFNLDSPPRTGIGLGSITGKKIDQLCGTRLVNEWINTKPFHGFWITVNGEQGRDIGMHNLAQKQSLSFFDWEVSDFDRECKRQIVN